MRSSQIGQYFLMSLSLNWVCRPCQFYVGCVTFIQIFYRMVRSHGINLNKTDMACEKLTQLFFFFFFFFTFFVFFYTKMNQDFIWCITTFGFIVLLFPYLSTNSNTLNLIKNTTPQIVIWDQTLLGFNFCVPVSVPGHVPIQWLHLKICCSRSSFNTS